MFRSSFRSQAPSVVLVLLLVIASGPVAAEDGLVGYWNLNEGRGEQVEDNSANANAGRLVNSPQWIDGVDGSALSFEGQDDYVEVPHSNAIDLGAEDGSYTLSFWFSSSTPPSDPPDAHLLTKHGFPYPFTFVQTAHGVLQFRIYDGSVCCTLESGIDVSDGDWHYVVGIRDGQKERLLLYVDGLLVSSTEDTTKGEMRNDGPLRIGRSHGDDFSGAIDDVKIYSRLLSREETRSPFEKPVRSLGGRRIAGKRVAAQRAEGVPAMRKRAGDWHPTLAADANVQCIKDGAKVKLKNAWMDVAVSLETGEVTSLVSRGRELLASPGGVIVRDVVSGVEFTQAEGTVSGFKVADDSPMGATVTVQKRYADDYAATIAYTLGAQALCCDVRLTTDLPEARESRIEFNMPALSEMTKVFWTRDGAPFELSEPPAELIVYRQFDGSTATVLPSLTAYDPAGDVGLSFVAPFDLPKPGVHFRLDTHEKRLGISNFHLRLAKGEPARAALYIVPHEGCWRPSLAWMLKTYPEYFRPGTEGAIETPGWYWLGGPLEGREQLEDLKTRGCKWFQIHSHFPFYGLYMPETESWDVVLGLADQGKANLGDWEAGKDQGGFENSYDRMRKAIGLRQECGMQPLLYFQSFELWDQYAAKHFAGGIAKNRNGDPHGAWYNCNLMNPDPAFAWGRHIAAQIARVPKEYPSIDGIFYDRDDYKQYDYAHDDGVTMDADVPCYPLCFAQQQINQVITGVLRKHGMAILTNGPTSVEVCKHIDAIMCETNAWASCHQYLGLARPMVLLPYFFETSSYDKEPANTEEKLKVALSTGFFPSLTYGGEESKRMERKFKPLFELMKDREWVLHANALTLPENMRGNIFRSPEGYYIVTVVDFAKSQVAGDTPTPGMDVAITVPDAAAMKYCYVLSGDDPGPNAVPFSREGTTIRTKIPFHLACSMVVFSDEPRFEVPSAPLSQDDGHS